MASIALTLKNADEQTIAQYGLESGRLEQIEAINGAYYQFTDTATGTGPVRIDTARSGDDLLLSFNGSGSTDLVIKDYFARGEGALIGFQANGEIYHYPVITAPEHLLAETLAAPGAGVATPAALGAVAAVAVVAGGIAIATHNHDKHDNHRDNAPQPHSPDTPDNTGNPPSPPNQNPGNNTNPLLPPGPNQPNPNNPNPNNPNPNKPNPNNPNPNNPNPNNPNPNNPNPNNPNPNNPNPNNPNPNNPQPAPNKAGTVTIQGEAKVGSELKATVKDDDGVDASKIKYQWQRDGVDIKDATGSSYKLGAADVGHKITVKASYTDNANHSESLTSTATDSVTDDTIPPPNPNPQPNHAGTVSITGDTKVGNELKAEVKDDDGFDSAKVKYQWQRDGVDIKDATSSSYKLGAADVGHKITVKASYTDNAQHSEAPTSAATTPVVDPANPNPNPQPQPNHEGDVAISGNAKVGETLTAKVDDADGVPNNVQYQWLANGVAIAGATGSSYQLTANDAGKTISVRATYTDNANHSEAPTSAATAPVVDPANPNPNPNPQPQPNHEGDVAISGNAKVGETLTAEVHDADQFDESKVSYQWLRDGKEIAGANSKTYTLTVDDEGHKVSVKAEYTDNAGHKESHDAESGVVQPQTSTNHAPTDISLDNDKVAEGKDGATVGKLTTTDPDTGDKHTYKVSDDRFEVTADGTLKLKDGKHLDFATEPKVTLQVSSDDGHGGMTSKEFTLQVQDDPNYPTPNPQPPQPPQPQPNHAGTVSITGEAKVGSELKAAVKDDDGFDSANVKYQWLRDGQKISGAEGESYKLTAADVGHKISVQATYDDNAKNHESPTSAQTDAVVDSQTPPKPQPNHAGTVSITGEAKVGSELKAAVKDDDGFDSASVKYQWLRDGQPIDGANGKSYTLQAADVGHKISVKATYKDNAQHDESPTSAQTDAVTDNTTPPNPQPQPPQPNEPGITLTGSKEVTEGGKATYTVSLDNRALPQANSAAELLHNLQSNKGILFGQQRGLDVAFSPENSEGHHSDVYALTSHYPSIIGLGMMEPPMVRGLSNEENGKRMGEAIKKIDGVGGIAQLSAFWDMPGGETDRTKIDLKRLLPGGDQNAELNGWLDAIVETGKHAVRDDGTKIPFIFRPLHEANGEWAWWYYERGGAETYKELFRYVVSYLKEHGLDGQFLTAFAPNGNFNGDESRYKLLYPGDDVVDVLSMDSYDTNNALLAKDKWAGELVEDMAMLARMAEARGKLAAVAEFGREGDKVIHPDGNKDLNWYTDVLEAIKANPDAAKVAYMMTWANFGGSPVFSAFTPWPGHEMADNFREFVKQMTMTRNAERDITVDVTIEHGTTDDGDIKTTTHTVTIPKGQNNATFTVDAVADGKQEGDEHYTVRISKAQGGQIEAGKDSVTTTIHDEGSAPPANHAGTVTISGEAKEDTSLTATVADEDGVPNGVAYQWLRDGKPIDGAHQKTYVLRPDDVGHKISVRATYQDNAAHDEAPTSSETDAVVAKQAQPQPNRLGTVEISGVAKVGETLLATVSDADGVPNDVAYKWFADGQEIAGAAAATFKLTNAEKDKTITVQALYTDARGTAEQPLSAATDKVADTTAPGANGAGKLVISGTAKVGQTLTAAVTDPDGVPDKLEYQWFADGSAIRGATGSSYTLTDAEKYKVISVSARYTDLAGHAENVKGDIAPGDINTSISPDFLARQAQYKDLINSAAHKYDIDKALIHAIISVESAYQQEHIAPTNGAIGLMQLAPATAQMLGVNPHNAAENVDGGVRYLKTQLDRFHDVNLALAAYYDGPQTVEKYGNQVPPFASTKRYLDRVHGYQDIYQNERPELINDLGTLRVSGEAKIGANLAAEISDYDGVDPAKVQYQWRRDGKAIDGATGKTYTLQAADAGKTITLHAEYQDDRGVKESLDSGAITPPSANNHAPTGSVTISGTAKVGQTLIASNTLQDADGMGAITYRWFADGTEVGQGANYQIRATDKGKTITVKAEYTDGQAHAESVASQPTAAVSEDAPNQPGSVTITGDAKVGGTLTADVKDGDGVPTDGIKYQWQRDGQPVDGATAKTYQLTAADAGHKITVQATYDDNAAHHETPTSPATDIAAADPHAGAITVSGAAKVGAVLTTAITDADGVPKTGIHYQWYADGKAIDGATHEVYRIRPGDIGKTISVQASYTDNSGHAETTNTAAVAQNVADNPASQSALGHKLYAHEEFGKYIDARDFGVNPANADNTAALKAALKAADDEGAALYLGAGTLKLHEQIRIGADVHDKSGKLIQEGYENVRAIFGAGAGETHLTFDWQQTEGERFYPRAKDDRFNPWNNRTNVNPYAAILIDGVNGKSVADLSLEYRHKTPEDFYQKTKSYFGLINGIIVNDADNTKIDTVEISGMNRAGVYFTSTLAESSGARDKLKTHQISEADVPTGDNNQLIYSNLHHNRVAGALVAFQKNFTADSNHLAWNGHEADGGTGYGIASMAGSYGFGITYSRNTTDHNYRKGLDIHDGNHITIEDNTLNGDRLHGIVAYNRQYTMDDVTIRRNHITADPNFRLAEDDGDEIAGGTPNYHLYSGIQLQTNTQPTIQDLQSKGPGKFDISDNTISGMELYRNAQQTYGIEFRNQEPEIDYTLNIRGNHISGESTQYGIAIINNTIYKNRSSGKGSGDIAIEANTIDYARNAGGGAPLYLEEKATDGHLRGSVKINHNVLTLREASEGATEAIAMHGNAKTYDVGHNTFELHGNVHDRPVVRINGSSSSAKPHLNLHDNTFQTEDHFDASWLKYGNASVETHNNTLNGKALVTAGSPYQHETPQLLHAHDGYQLNAETALHYPLPAAQPAKHAPYDSLETDKLHELLENHGGEHHAAPAHAPYDSLETDKLHELLGAHGGANHEHGATAKTAAPHYDATHQHHPVSHLPQEDPYTIL